MHSKPEGSFRYYIQSEVVSEGQRTRDPEKRDANAIKYCTCGFDRGAGSQGPVLLQNNRIGVAVNPAHDTCDC